MTWFVGSYSARNACRRWVDFFREMWVGPAVALAMGLTLGMQGDLAGSGAWAPVLLLWLISPGVAWWISVPLSACEADLHDDQRLFLRTSARRTWCFFDDFVGPEDHWLPPDNVQEYPAVVIASRTSPTNIGMGLLAKPPVVVRPPE